MKEKWRRLKSYLDKSLRRQLVFYLMFCVLLPFTAVTSLLFVKARREMKRQAVVNVRQRAEAIAGNVDELIYNIQGVSDKFAYDVEIGACVEKKYGELSMEKQRDTYALNSYFEKTDLLNEDKRISALYTKRGEVINFLDPYLSGESVKERMVRLGAEDGSRLSMFTWFPLQENFLASSKTGDTRRDKVVVGVRRILHPFTGAFLYTQFFTIEEREIWDIYEKSAGELQGEVYISDGDGRLISAYREEALHAACVPEEIRKASGAEKSDGFRLTYENKNYIMSRQKLSNVGWTVITMVPVEAVTATIDRLFKEIILVMFVCILGSVGVITWISNRFLQPVEVLDESMKEVYNGNLVAYVKPENYHGEIQSMMRYYNSMLMSINRFIEERVESEKKKKELELEVLMGQINPHFLYNTLENIVWKSNEVGRPDIGRLAASLGRLYRLSIGNGETIVSVQQELEHVMAYVNIQKNRYKERVEFDLQVDYETIWGLGMIKLTLQPVVENCFMYGMEGIDRVLKIRLKVRAGEEFLRFFITDNGRGLGKSQLERVRDQIVNGKVKTEEAGRRGRKGTGIGLYSVRERIAIYTGFHSGVKIQSKKDMGTVVTITIPRIPIKDKNEP